MRLYTDPDDASADSPESESAPANVPRIQEQEFPKSALGADVVDTFTTADTDAVFETQEMPLMLSNEEIMGAVECASLNIIVLNGFRYVFAATGTPNGTGIAYSLAEKAGELLNQHLRSPESIANVAPNDQAG